MKNSILGLPKCGIARLSDVNNDAFLEAFKELEEFSNSYISEMIERKLFPTNYQWPLDSLHNWSRWWEYTFVWLRLKKLLSRKSQLIIVDIGSALTFFPLFLATKGARVLSLDRDITMGRLAKKAVSNLSMLTPNIRKQIKFVAADACSLPFADSKCDVVTNISVIEHLKNKTGALKEMFRVLRPGGKMFTTFDLSLNKYLNDESMPLDVNGSYAFNRLVESVFAKNIRFHFVHPLDVLTPENAPKRLANSRSLLQKLFFNRKINMFYFLWHCYIRQMLKLTSSILLSKPLILGPVKLLRFLSDPKRLEFWTVMGVAVEKKR